jgi:hypothetical protein
MGKLSSMHNAWPWHVADMLLLLYALKKLHGIVLFYHSGHLSQKRETSASACVYPSTRIAHSDQAQQAYPSQEVI